MLVGPPQFAFGNTIGHFVQSFARHMFFFGVTFLRGRGTVRLWPDGIVPQVPFEEVSECAQAESRGRREKVGENAAL